MLVVFFATSRNLKDKYFDIVWGYQPPETPKCTPQNQFFLAAYARVLVF